MDATIAGIERLYRERYTRFRNGVAPVTGNYETAHDAYERALLANADEQERVAAVRAASEALSERINSNLRDPPLLE